MAVADRLAELGLTLPQVAAPAGAYVPAIATGELVFTAGQLPFVDGELAVTGKVGEGEGQDNSPKSPPRNSHRRR